MPSSLYAYTITANVRRKTDEHLKLDDLPGDGGGGDLLDSFDTAVAKDAEWPPVEGEIDTRTAILRVEDVYASSDDPRIRYGRVRVTRYAVRHDVEQAASGDVIPILERDREGRPVFFWIVAPTASTSALLLTERHARFGIVTRFWQGLLIGQLRDDFPDATFKLMYYMPQEIWQEYLDRGTGVDGAILQRAMLEEREDKELDEPTRRRTIGTITTKIDRKVAAPRDRVADIIRRADRRDAVELVLGDYDDSIGTSRILTKSLCKCVSQNTAARSS